MKKRIWELDALRGLCILGMVIVHFVYDLVELYALVPMAYPKWFAFVKDWGGVLFLLLSGTCATLGSGRARRGLLVFACGMVCTAVTLGMYLLGFSGKEIIIYFGVLHCLGVCMLLWGVFRKLPTWVLACLGTVLAVLGLWLRTRYVSFPWLIVLGFVPDWFASSDFFPLLPNLGFFLLGAVLGRTVYREKTTRLPKVNAGNPALRFLTLCGRHSLGIYLLHQPILAGIMTAVSMILRG